MSDTAPDANVQVSHEVNGRTLSGMGASPEQLESVMERHAPEPTEGAPAGTAAPPSPAEGDAASVAPAPDKLTRGRQRFADLTAERDAAKAEAAAAKTEREALARERDELKARVGAPPATERPAAAPPKPASEKFPAFEIWLEKPENAEKDWNDYTDARVAHNYAALRAAERAEESAVSAEQTQREQWKTYSDGFAAMRAEAPDFDTVLGAIGPTDVSKVVEQAVIAVGARAAYYLGKHLDELRALTAETVGVSPDSPAFGATVAATKRYLQTLVTPRPAVPARAAAAPPPAPYTAVNGNSVTTATPSSELAGKGFDFDKSGYREKRAAERKAGRR